MVTFMQADDVASGYAGKEREENNLVGRAHKINETTCVTTQTTRLSAESGSSFSFQIET
jgi:hypothetical protein